MNRQAVAVDMDGVLCELGGWRDMATAKPRPEGIAQCNELFDKGHAVIVHTARRPEDYAVTYGWLTRHKVKFTALEMGKVRADHYIDDKNAEFEDLKLFQTPVKHICILYSGGLDSLIMGRMAHRYVDRVDCVYFDLGHGYAKHEIQRLPGYVDVRKVEWFKGETEFVGKPGSKSGNIIIPGRNMVLATMAAAMYTPEQVWLGALLGENHGQSTDKNEEFRRRMNAATRYVLSPFQQTENVVGRLVYPFIELGWDKLDMLRHALNNGWISEQEAIESRSCLAATEVPCGECVACIRRWGIFTQLGLAEEYMTDPRTTKRLAEMESEMLYGTHYDGHRRRELLPALGYPMVD